MGAKCGAVVESAVKENRTSIELYCRRILVKGPGHSVLSSWSTIEAGSEGKNLATAKAATRRIARRAEPVLKPASPGDQEEAMLLVAVLRTLIRM